MTPAFFDTHHYVKRLQISGTPTTQAEAHAGALAEIMSNQFVKKSDLNIFTSGMKGDFNELKIEVKMEIHDMKNELSKVKADVNTFKVEVKGQFDLLKWMIGFSIATSIGILIKLSH